MNIENIKITIDIMKRAMAANSLCMYYFQNGETTEVSEKSMHACGNTACLAGHIAVSPEFKAIGGIVGDDGSPLHPDSIYTDHAPESMGLWFGVSDELARYFIYNYAPCTADGEPHILYGVNWGNVTPTHVIAALEWLLTVGEEAALAELTKRHEEVSNEY